MAYEFNDNFIIRDPGNQIGFGRAKHYIEADVGTFNSSLHTKSLSVGQSSKSSGECSIALGNLAASTNSNSISIGAFTSAIHENSIVIGCNATSEKDNSLTIKHDHVKINDIDVSCGVLDMNDDVSIIYQPRVNITQTGTQHTECHGCSNRILRGIKWIKSDDTKNTVDIELGLCFDCMYDCVIYFKTLNYWKLHSGMKAIISDPIDNLSAEILKLKEEVAQLQQAHKNENI